jgi:hypothetical protein
MMMGGMGAPAVMPDAALQAGILAGNIVPMQQAAGMRR